MEMEMEKGMEKGMEKEGARRGVLCMCGQGMWASRSEGGWKGGRGRRVVEGEGRVGKEKKEREREKRGEEERKGKERRERGAVGHTREITATDGCPSPEL